MFEFAVKGSVVGFNTAQDGRTFVKIQPVSSGNLQLQREERLGYLDVLVPSNVMKSLAAGSAVQVRGKGYVIFKDWRDPKTLAEKTFTNYRYEAEAIEPVKAA